MSAVLSELRASEHVDDGYSAFYRRYHRPLTCYLRMNFRDADTEGVAQEAFCRALSHWAQVGRLANGWPWLVVTARNLARNNIRDEKASQAAGLQVFHPSACSSADVAEQVEAFDQLRRLARAMSVLTPLQRQLLTVMIEEGLTGPQVARRLGMTPGAVRMHLSRMRSRLGDRFVSLGGTLGVLPVALAVGVDWLVRRRRFGGQQLALATGSSALTLSMAIAIAIGVSGSAPALPATDAVPATSHDESRADVGSLPTARVAQAQVAAAGGPGAAAPVPPMSTVAYRLQVSKRPTDPGTTAYVSVEVATPVGEVYVRTPITQDGSLPPVPPCPQPVSC